MRIEFIQLALLFVLCSTLVMPLQEAQASSSLAVDLADEHIDITTGFDGAYLVLYGVKRPSDTVQVAIVVKGPNSHMLVRKKQNVMGVWMNMGFVNFKNVPGYYNWAVSENFNVDDFDASFLKEHGIGFEYLVFEPEEQLSDVERKKTFQQALIRNKQTAGVYPSGAGVVERINDSFFKARIYMPANLPKGEYTIEAFVLEKGKVLEQTSTTLQIQQVGFSAMVSGYAHTQGLAYGLICVFLAVFAGWGVNVIRRS